MHFVILGQVAAHDGSTSPRLPNVQRKVLCALLLARPDGMTVEALLAAMWGEERGRQHENTLKTQVSHLRTVLGNERVPRAHGGVYQVALRPGDTLDLDQFRALVGQARPHLAGQEWAPAARLLRQALSLWRSPALPDVPDESEHMREVRAGLLDERRAALIGMAHAHMGIGQHAEVVADLRHALIEDPLDEQLHHLLMTALNGSGQRAAALNHFEQLRDRLAEETGTAPGGELLELVRQIEDGDTPAPVPVLPAAGTGWVVPAQLPPDVPDFTGRDEEITEIAYAVTGRSAGVPVVAVQGPGGIGKSTLAVRAAHRVREQFPDGQLYVNFAAMSGQPLEPGEALAQLLAGLGVHRGDLPRSTRERTGLLRSILAGRRVLLVVDDVAGDHQVLPLLPGTAGCAVIVTSRLPLSQGVTRWVRLDPLTPDEGLGLLAEIVGPRRVAAEPEQAVRIVTACGGFPLALRLAGARLAAQPHWSMAYFADHLGEGINAGTGGPVSVSELVAAGSYEALPEPARRVFRALSLTGTNFPAWLPGMLFGDGSAEAMVETLAAYHLIVPAGVDGYGEPRYRQHDLIRSYAAARLADDPVERSVVVERLLGGTLELTGLANQHMQADPHHPPAALVKSGGYACPKVRAMAESDPQRGFTFETSNLLYAVRLACLERQAVTAHGIGEQINAHLFWARRNRDAEDMWRAVMRVCENAGEHRLAADARLRVAALITRLPGGAERAVPMLDGSVDVFDRLGDRSGLGRALAARAFACWTMVRQHPESPARDWHLQQAADDARRGLDAARAAGNEFAELGCLRGLGISLAALGRPSEGLPMCDAALRLSRRIATTHGQGAYHAYTLRQVIITHLDLGDYQQALTLISEGHQVTMDFAHTSGEASWFELEGDAFTGLGRHPEATERYRQAAELYEGHQDAYNRERCQRKHAQARQRAAG